MLKKIIMSIVSLFICASAITTIANAREIVQVPHWQKKVINVYIPKNDDQKTVSLLKSAFGSWQGVSAGNIKFQYVEKGPADIDITFIDSATESTGPITTTNISTSGNAIIKADIKVANNSKQYKNSSDSYISKVFQHEVGRSLGLPINTRKESSIMHTPITEKQKLMKIDVIKLFSISEWPYSTRRIKKED